MTKNVDAASVFLMVVFLVIFFGGVGYLVMTGQDPFDRSKDIHHPVTNVSVGDNNCWITFDNNYVFNTAPSICKNIIVGKCYVIPYDGAPLREVSCNVKG